MKRQPASGPAGIDLFRNAPSINDAGETVTVDEHAPDMQLKRIDEALRRLESGRFGHCLYCGDRIGLKRLTADPAVSSCVTCDED